MGALTLDVGAAGASFLGPVLTRQMKTMGQPQYASDRL